MRFGLHKAYADGDCCEAIHLCACLCVLMHKGYGHCDCCEVMHVLLECVFLYVKCIRLQ